MFLWVTIDIINLKHLYETKLFVYVSFIRTCSNSIYTASKWRMTSENLIEKKRTLWISGGDLIWYTIPAERLKKPTKNSNQDSRCPGWGSNRAVPNYKSEALPHEVTRCIIKFRDKHCRYCRCRSDLNNCLRCFSKRTVYNILFGFWVLALHHPSSLTSHSCCHDFRGIYWTQNVTTNNYDSPTELHTPKITVTTAHIKSLLSLLFSQVVAWWRISEKENLCFSAQILSGWRLSHN
jgi:hypothetical protein